MKKIVVGLIVFFSMVINVYSEEKINVFFSQCIDGDTAKFIMDDQIIKVRFLAIDTPESTTEKEPYGEEASYFTCEKLKNASKIELEFDSNSDKIDKYNRYLAWIWVDNYLLQDLIISNGLGEIAYLYDDYKYTDLLKEHQSIAKTNNIGMWNNEEVNTSTTYNYTLYGLFILIILMLYVYSTNFRKKARRKFKIKRQLN